MVENTTTPAPGALTVSDPKSPTPEMSDVEYGDLLTTVASTVIEARRTAVAFYWDLGGHVYSVIGGDKDTPRSQTYGQSLVANLADDMLKHYGVNINKRTLYRAMRVRSELSPEQYEKLQATRLEARDLLALTAPGVSPNARDRVIDQVCQAHGNDQTVDVAQLLSVDSDATAPGIGGQQQEPEEGRKGLPADPLKVLKRIGPAATKLAEALDLYSACVEHICDDKPDSMMAARSEFEFACDALNVLGDAWATQREASAKFFKRTGK